MSKSLYERVRERARWRCEYCHAPQEFDLLPLQFDHIIPLKHGGPTAFENLALACFPCNNCKGCNLAGINPLTGRVIRLFNPRKDRWDRHFHWNGGELVGKTATGVVTIAVLEINLYDRVLVREVLFGGDFI